MKVKVVSLLRRFWWVLILIALVAGVIVYRSNVTRANELKTKTHTVSKQNLVDSLSISGQIDAYEKASLRFQTSGLLSWVGVKEGDMVKKYQAVASLDRRELQNQMSQLLNTYTKSRWDFEQAQDDNRNWQTAGMTDDARTAVKRVLDKHQYDLNNAVLDVEAKNISLKYATLISPIAGLVTKVAAPVSGQNITPASAEFVVINPKTIYFSALADQTEVTKFQVGQKALLMLDSYPEKKIEGVVESIAFTPKEGESGTVYELKIAVNIDNSDYSVRIGMTGDSEFIFEEKNNVLAIPTRYITTDKENSYVKRIRDGKEEKVIIKTGMILDGQTEILDGLNENDVIYGN